MKLPRYLIARLPADIRPPRKSKYGVGPPEERTYNGVTYDSIAEALRARDLDWLVRSGEVESVDRQVTFQLGPDCTYRADFVVHHSSTRFHVEEVKGFETRDFHRVRRLWKKYGRGRLVIMTRQGKGWSKEILTGGMDEYTSQD